MPARRARVRLARIAGIGKDAAGKKSGADAEIRTPDLLITSELLYQLSYISPEKPPTYLHSHPRALNIIGMQTASCQASNVSRARGHAAYRLLPRLRSITLPGRSTATTKVSSPSGALYRGNISEIG